MRARRWPPPFDKKDSSIGKRPQLCGEAAVRTRMMGPAALEVGSLLPAGLGGLADACGVGSRLIMERFGELRGIEYVVKLALVEHLVRFPHGPIEPSRQLEHRPSQDAVLRCRPELLCGETYKLFSGRGIGRSGDVPSLIPRALGIYELNQAASRIGRECKRVLH